MTDDDVEYECKCEDCGRVWRSGGDYEGPIENICPNCMSESITYASL